MAARLAIGIALALSLALSASRASAQDTAARAQLALDVASGADEAGGDSAHPAAQSDGDLARGRSRDVAVNLAAGKCYIAVARGAGIENVDVAFSRGRTVLVRDTDTGASALARYCPGAAERVSVRVTAFRGQGAFVLGVYEVRPEAEQAHADAGVAVGTVLERLDALSRAQTGYAPVTPPARETLTEGQTVERSITVSPGRCYRVLVTSDPGVTDVDLVLLAPGEGGEVQRDGTARADASLGVLRPLCPASPGAHRLRVTLAHGAGAIAWQAMGNQVLAGGGTANAPASHFTVGAADFLGARIRTRAAQLTPGGTAVSDVARATVQTSQTHEFTAEVTGGRCYDALGAGAASVRQLELVVHDGLNNEVGRSAERDAQPSARFCPQIATRVRVTLRPIVGYGQVAGQVIEVAH